MRATTPILALAPVAERGAGVVPVIALLPDAEVASALWAVGVRGLLLRSAPADQLAAAIGAVGAGLLAVDPALARALPVMRPPGPTETLTPRGDRGAGAVGGRLEQPRDRV